jgi:hypothetical protein
MNVYDSLTLVNNQEEDISQIWMDSSRRHENRLKVNI